MTVSNAANLSAKSTRRAVLGGLAAAGLAAATPVSATAVDAELIALCARFDALESRVDALHDAVADDAARDALVDPLVAEQGELIERIVGLPPRSLDGCQALARAAAHWERERLLDEGGPSDRLIALLLRGLSAGV